MTGRRAPAGLLARFDVSAPAAPAALPRCSKTGLRLFDNEGDFSLFCHGRWLGDFRDRGAALAAFQVEQRRRSAA